MKTITIIFLGLHVLAAIAQTLGPSPTESVGCVAHGDHWDCVGPVTTSAAISGSPSAATTTATSSAHDHAHEDEDEDHEHEEHTDALGSGTLPPSPTASIGCEPHGDHWHCDGPASTITSAAAATTTAAPSTSSVSTTIVPAGGARNGLSGAAGIAGLLGFVIWGL